MGRYRRINNEERCQMYALNKQSSSQKNIAEILGISQSAVSRELTRNRGKTSVATRKAAVRRLKPIDYFVHTITFDNGKEFADHQNMASALNADIRPIEL